MIGRENSQKENAQSNFRNAIKQLLYPIHFENGQIAMK
jgi:hypothetical protein